MKVTRLRITRSKQQFVKTLTLDEMLLEFTKDTRYGEVESLRRSAREALEYKSYSQLGSEGLLPEIYPAAVMKRENDGSIAIKDYNPVVLLSVGNLYDNRDVLAVKQAAKMLPMTMIAIKGSSGMSVKILVSIFPDDGRMPTTEEDMNAFLADGYERLAAVYSAVLPHPVTGGGGSLSVRFRRTLDDDPYRNPNPTPFRVIDNREKPVQQIDTTPLEPADDTKKAVPGEETRQLIEYLGGKYSFRYNKVMGYTEFMRVNAPWSWRPVDERATNSFAMEARVAGLNVWDKDVRRYINSTLIKDYDPVSSYLWGLEGKWDRVDHIRQLARTVPNDCPYWEDWFYTWFLGMVAQWMGWSRRYGNSVVPLLISKQGYNKSTFCRSLIPPDLQWGYNDSLVLSEKRQVLQAMSQFLLINLDEFNQIPQKVQEGFLKNIIQLASVKVKRPYGKHVEEQQRYASFIATANMTDILTDPSGNRRFIAVELTGPIKIGRSINHKQLYAQAVAAIRNDERYWFDAEQTELIIENNRKFQQLPSSMQYFNECFVPAKNEEEGTFLSATAIYDRIRHIAGSRTNLGNLRQFGRLLTNLDGLIHKHNNQGTVYLVKEIR